MPADLVTRINLDKLYLPFAEKLLECIALCRDLGADYFAISGFRSYEEQAALYFQGRTSPGPRVTNARPGQSLHNFGLACDLVRDGVLDRRGLQPDYRPESYEILGVCAAQVGLEWGGGWKLKDFPHVQFRGCDSPARLRAVKKAFDEGGLEAAWRNVSLNAGQEAVNV